MTHLIEEDLPEQFPPISLPEDKTNQSRTDLGDENVHELKTNLSGKLIGGNLRLLPTHRTKINQINQITKTINMSGRKRTYSTSSNGRNRNYPDRDNRNNENRGYISDYNQNNHGDYTRGRSNERHRENRGNHGWAVTHSFPNRYENDVTETIQSREEKLIKQVEDLKYRIEDHIKDKAKLDREKNALQDKNEELEKNG